MDKLIAVKENDGGVDVIYPAPEMFDENSLTRKLVPELNGATDEQIWEFIKIPHNLNEKSWRYITKELLPTSMYFRQAWTDDNDTDTIDVDITKAKAIKLNIFREIRIPLLETLDVDYLRALEQGEDTSAITAAKQALRDVTTIELPDNIDELEVFMPDILKAV